jgi:hypothetical protein
MGSEICRRADALATISEDPGGLTRVFLSPEHRRASDLVMSWMRDAGMAVHVDAIGNVVGRYEGTTPGLPALVLGSHLDTVRDAGRYDGMLGVVTSISCIGALNREGRRLDCHRSDRLLRRGGRAVRHDDAGQQGGRRRLRPGCARRHRPARHRDALRGFGLDPDKIPTVIRHGILALTQI